MILSSTSTMYADGQLTINSSSSTFGSLVMPGTYGDGGGALFEYGRYVNSVAGGWDLIRFTCFWIADIFIYKL